ncbi:hypothetical protein PB2503_10999 [Parvularcula bermudensis HTCC2503]|uniref:Lipoprotein n=1 Tax=Parvularcula bermudensis (strain ATCC BAA-594 / HTCC2503 / KCTC 12087) TaxID=314260 RepID=E0THV4_PARBH|nr:hypothetical protein [Parvularcula bermudensis]ADM10247.1 hypothetical protein PB2503_10999 [Parvularcula bermudensis HTCC2503]
MYRSAIVSICMVLVSACGSDSSPSALKKAYVNTCSRDVGGWADQGFESKADCQCYNAFMPEMAGLESAKANLALLDSGSADAVDDFNRANAIAKSTRSEARSQAIDKCLL